MTEEELAKYVSVVPNRAQLAVQELKFYAFVHYGMNTFTGREWGTGKEDEKLFAPRCQDTDQWCRAIKSAGMKAVILTCKHHDGFCLWQTETTEHSIKNSPYKGGKGDVVRELSDSCRKYGLKFGVYLSPWDRNSKYYSTPEYNDFYIAQLTELLDGRYGEIFMLWMDGACGSEADGKPAQKYDFARIWTTARRLQPGIALSDCGPDIRWIGNESGRCRESEWNVVPAFDFDLQNIADKSQKTDNPAFAGRCADVCLPDMGSRAFLKDFDDFIWYPAEADVSMHRGWFFHENETHFKKSLDRLMRIYYASVGSNALLLLNVPPDRDGLIHPADEKRLAEMGRLLRREDELVTPSAVSRTPDGLSMDITFPECSIDRLRLAEDTTFSQRVESFSLFANGRKIYSGTIIGFSKIVVFEPVTTGKITLKIDSCRLGPHIGKVEVVKTGAWRA